IEVAGHQAAAEIIGTDEAEDRERPEGSIAVSGPDSESRAHHQDDVLESIAIEVADCNGLEGIRLQSSRLEGAIPPADPQTAGGHHVPEAIPVEVGGGQIAVTPALNSNARLHAEFP